MAIRCLNSAEGENFKAINGDCVDVLRQFPVLSCTLLQPGDVPACDDEGKLLGRYCEWMPYQIGVATANPAA